MSRRTKKILVVRIRAVTPLKNPEAVVRGLLDVADRNRSRLGIFRRRPDADGTMRDIDAIETVGVVGAGTMGNGIAQVAATAGYDVVMRDVDAEYVEAGLDDIETGLSKSVENDELTRGAADAARITTS